MKLNRPLYESLPYVYIVVGIGAIVVSFLWREPRWSDWLALFGAVAVVTGLVLTLKRRDYRIQQRHYGGHFEEEED